MKLSFMQYKTLNEENMGTRERVRTWGESERQNKGREEKE
jgi:hypothetical protein